MQYWTLAEHFAYFPLGTANKVPLGWVYIEKYGALPLFGPPS